MLAVFTFGTLFQGICGNTRMDCSPSPSSYVCGTLGFQFYHCRHREATAGPSALSRTTERNEESTGSAAHRRLPTCTATRRMAPSRGMFEAMSTCLWPWIYPLRTACSRRAVVLLLRSKHPKSGWNPVTAFSFHFKEFVIFEYYICYQAYNLFITCLF